MPLPPSLLQLARAQPDACDGRLLYTYAQPRCHCAACSASVLQAQVRYLLRVTVARGMGQSVVKEAAFWVRNAQEAPVAGPPIKVRAGTAF